MFCKNFATEKHLCWSLFLIKLQAWRSATLWKRDSNTDVFLWIFTIFENSFSYWNLRWLLLSVRIIVLWFDKVNCSVIGICRPSLLNQKHIVGWFLLKRFVVLSWVCSLFLFSRNHSNTFLWINLQKTKTCPKLNTAARTICSDARIVTFRQVFVHYYVFVHFHVYLNHMQISRWLHLSRSLWGIPLLCDNSSEKEYTRKNSSL